MYYGLDPSRSAAATYAPQGFFGDIVSQVAAPIGSTIGGWAGNQQLGQQIGGIAGGIAKLIPFEAGPTPAYAPMAVSYAPQSAAPAAYAPQGFFGDIVSQIAPPIVNGIADYVGHPQLGPQIGTVASGLAKLIPFDAAPAAPAYAPQGLIGGLLGGPVGSWLGGAIGGALGNRGLGETIGGTAGGIGGGFLPFQAAPSPYLGAIR